LRFGRQLVEQILSSLDGETPEDLPPEFRRAEEATLVVQPPIYRARHNGFPPAIRKAIYKTNAIESVNSVIRKFTRNR
jgi:hypothetical protein